MGKVKFGQRLKAGSKQAGFGVPFAITYHPKLKKIAQTMKKLERLLYQDESVKRVFTPPPIVSYHSARKISSYLVRAKLYFLERKRGSYKCGNLRCIVCNNLEETDTFTSTVTGESFKTNHHLCCNDKCLIYTGKTVDRSRLRSDNYKESDRKFLSGEESKQKSLHEHFLSDSCQSFEEDFSICLIDKNDPSDPHKREYYWMRTLKTIAPFGLNTEETY